MGAALQNGTQQILTDHLFLVIWVGLVMCSTIVLLLDLQKNNPEIAGLMKAVWTLTVIYSGPLGLFVYWATGRKQIARDSIWRKGARSTAHCYSGCGAGEIVGVIIAAGFLALGNWWVAGITFGLAYIFGFSMTVGPLLQEGVAFPQALQDAFYSETASITVMEVTAIAVGLWLGGRATIEEPLFWSSMILSLSMGLLAAYPVNVALIRAGVKEGMHNPKHMAEAHAHTN